MQQPAILEAFAELSDSRQASGERHLQPLRLALFTMTVVAGNQGFFASAPSQKTAIVTLQPLASAPRQS
jgi:hypothetical protein